MRKQRRRKADLLKKVKPNSCNRSVTVHIKLIKQTRLDQIISLKKKKNTPGSSISQENLKKTPLLYSYYILKNEIFKAFHSLNFGEVLKGSDWNLMITNVGISFGKRHIHVVGNSLGTLCQFLPLVEQIRRHLFVFRARRFFLILHFPNLESILGFRYAIWGIWIIR